MHWTLINMSRINRSTNQEPTIISQESTNHKSTQQNTDQDSTNHKPTHQLNKSTQQINRTTDQHDTNHRIINQRKTNQQITYPQIKNQESTNHKSTKHKSRVHQESTSTVWEKLTTCGSTSGGSSCRRALNEKKDRKVSSGCLKKCGFDHRTEGQIVTLSWKTPSTSTNTKIEKHQRDEKGSRTHLCLCLGHDLARLERVVLKKCVCN